MHPARQIQDDRIRDFDFVLDQLLVQLVLRDHPEWGHDDVDSFSCWLEVQRLRADADSIELLSG